MSVSVIGDWGREKREALEQLCFSFAPGKLLVEPAPLKRDKNLCFTSKHAYDSLLYFLRRSVVREKEQIFAQQNGRARQSCAFMSLVDQVDEK